MCCRVAEELIKNKMEKPRDSADDDSKSLLELYLSSEKLDIRDVLGMAVDMLLAGIDTVSRVT
jgi:hypothetical protein